MKYWFAFLIILFSLSACKYSKVPQKFTDNTIEIYYPSWLKKTDKLYPTAILQLQNKYRDVYYVLNNVGTVNEKITFEVLFDSLSNQLKNNIREPLVEKDTSYMINGFKVKEQYISGILANPKNEFRLLFIFDMYEKDGKMYQSAGWFFRHKRNVWETDVRKIILSFKEK